MYDAVSLPCGENRNPQHVRSEGEKTSDELSHYDYQAILTTGPRDPESGTEGGDKSDFGVQLAGPSEILEQDPLQDREGGLNFPVVVGPSSSSTLTKPRISGSPLGIPLLLSRNRSCTICYAY